MQLTGHFQGLYRKDQKRHKDLSVKNQDQDQKLAVNDKDKNEDFTSDEQCILNGTS